MNIEQMIEAVESVMGYGAEHLSGQEGRAIIAALKAGQAMRNASTNWEDNNAYAAWDEATREM